MAQNPNIRLTLRTLIAYLDDTLDPADSHVIGRKVQESEAAQELVERIRKAVRRRSLGAPPSTGDDGVDPNFVAEYLDNELTAEQLNALEEKALESEMHLAEIAACHQILSLVLSEPAKVPPGAHARMVALVKGPQSEPNRGPRAGAALASIDPNTRAGGSAEAGAGRDASSGLLRLLLGVAGMMVLLAGVLAVAGPGSKPPDRNDPVRDAVAQLTATDQQLVAARAEAKAARALPAPEPKVEPKDEPKVMPKAEPIPPPMAEPKEEPKARPARPLAPPIDRPNTRREPIGSARKADGLLVTRDARQEDAVRWARVLPAAPTVQSGDPLICLPGATAEVNLLTPVRLTLWGNLPDANALPIYESHVVLHAPGAGLEADLTLKAGRVYLNNTSSPARPVRARVRFADQAWDITLSDDKSEAMLDLISLFPPDVKFAPEGNGEGPLVGVKLAVVAGTVTLKAGAREFAAVPAPASLVWDNKGPGLGEPEKLAAPLPLWSRTPPTRSRLAPLLQKAAADLRARLARADVDPRTPLAEGVYNDVTTEASRVYGLFGLQALDAPEEVVNALRIEAHGDARYFAIQALRHWTAGAPGREGRLLRLLVDKRGYSAEDARAFCSLVHDFTPAEVRDPETYPRLFELLNSEQIALREIAFFHLAQIDGAAVSERRFAFDAAAPVEQRAAVVRAWKERVPAGALPPGVRKEPAAKE